MKNEHTVLIAGLGELGGLLLELLARSPTFRGRIIAADVNTDLGLRKTNSARQGAICWGIPSHIEFVTLDLSNVEATAEIVAREKPTLIVNCTTLATWWLRDLLPGSVKEELHAIGAGSGLWAAGHAALAYALMRGVRIAGSDAAVINSSYPDAVNPALARAGLAPMCGVGNGDLLVAPLCQLAASDLGVSTQRVRVTIVAHHFHAYNVLMHGNSRGLKFFVRITLDSDDVTGRFDIPDLLARVPDEARIPGAAGATWVVAASAMRTIEAYLTRSGAVVHVPGPAGLVGAWPVTLGPPLQLALPKDLSQAQANAINEAGQRAEGIDGFEADGTMVLGPVAIETLRNVFGFACTRYPLVDCLPIARELTTRLRELGEKHGISLKVH